MCFHVRNMEKVIELSDSFIQLLEDNDLFCIGHGTNISQFFFVTKENAYCDYKDKDIVRKWMLEKIFIDGLIMNTRIAEIQHYKCSL